MKPLHPSHCSLLWSHTSLGDWRSNTTMRYCLSVLSLAPLVLSAHIMDGVLFSKQTCQWCATSTLLLRLQLPFLLLSWNSAWLPGISFVQYWYRGRTISGFSCFPIWQFPKHFQNLILPISIFPAICLMKFPFLFFLPSVSSYHALTMHWTEPLLIS